jgi:hypothetical protein
MLKERALTGSSKNDYNINPDKDEWQNLQKDGKVIFCNTCV